MEVGISALGAGILQNDAPRARFEFGTGVPGRLVALRLLAQLRCIRQGLRE